MREKIIRITTVPVTLRILLRGQLKYINHEFNVMTISSKEVEYREMLKEMNIEGYEVNMTRQITPLKDLIALIHLVYIFIKEKPYIVHSHTPKAGTLGMLAAWITRVPNRLHTVAGLPLLVKAGWERRLLVFVEKITYACATKVYPNSFELRNLIERNHWVRVEKLKVIANGSSNGIDTNFFSISSVQEERMQIKKRLSILNEDFVFCFVGRIVKDKGINELVRAFDKLCNNHGHVKLLLIGPREKELDPIDEDVERKIHNNHNIISLGFQADVRPYFFVSNVLAFPSYREGFPNVVMQAGAMELPSIVSDINGCNEIIVHQKNGFIIPSQNEEALYKAMEYSLEHPLEIERMSKNARLMITSRYEQKNVWEALLNEYQSL